MLADAIRSEMYRLFQNRVAVFWSVLFVPLIFSIGGIVFHVLSRSRLEEMQGEIAPGALPLVAAVDLARGLVETAGLSANGAVLVFMLVGASVLYGGDYRWETWRLISARNSRLNLILSKVCAFAVLTLLGMAIFFAAGIIFAISGALISDRAILFNFANLDFTSLVLTLLLSFVRILQYAMIALLAAVVTRSLLTALLVPVVVGFAQTLLGGPGLALLGWEATGWAAQLLLPGSAFDTLKGLAATGSTDVVPDGLAMKSIAGLTLWTIAPLVAALAWFSRQDLSKE